MDRDSFTATDPADPAAGLARRRRRGRREIPFRYLLDSRLFRVLCASGETAALDGFLASLARHRLSPGGGLPALAMTPLAFLDAVGVDSPQYEAFSLPQNVTRSGESSLITGFVVAMAKELFSKAPELQTEALQKRVEELRQKTHPAAHELFDLCLTAFLSRPKFAEEIHTHLAFDFLYRYQFPDALREAVFDFLAVSLFAAGESVSGVSKMRVIKVFWDRSYERLLKKYPGARGEIQALDRAMKLRTYRDFLEWEVVHHSILGYGVGEVDRPVAAFTLESEETVRARCSAYKSALRAFLDQIGREELETTFRAKLKAWKPGLLAPCREDGTFDTVVSTGELPVY
ncbi:MAG TPA: hypothetical protein VE685_05985 [Thermoanaerobaculia bacterium]|nr:hypothetical protein [Thermoanaerobaculia bacterium]